MTGMPPTRSDEECAWIASASLEELAKTRDLRLEERDGESAYLLAADGTSYRFVVGRGVPGRRAPDEHLILIGWADAPLPFTLVPHPGVTYFDIRFGAHSRELDPVASQLKACLERNGCVFRTFSPPPRARGPLQVLRDIIRRH
jgi:hypothetical protein